MANEYCPSSSTVARQQKQVFIGRSWLTVSITVSDR
jgi:hypothetical protein